MDGKFVISASDDETIKLWSVATGALLQNIEAGEVDGASFSADGRYIISWYSFSTEDGVGSCSTLWGRIDSVAEDEPVWQKLETFYDDRLLKQKYPQFTRREKINYESAHGLKLHYRRASQEFAVGDGERTFIFYGDACLNSVSWSPDGMYLVVSDEAGRVLFLRYQSANT